jgi:hypothetical protein
MFMNPQYLLPITHQPLNIDQSQGLTNQLLKDLPHIFDSSMFKSFSVEHITAIRAHRLCKLSFDPSKSLNHRELVSSLNNLSTQMHVDTYQLRADLDAGLEKILCEMHQLQLNFEQPSLQRSESNNELLRRIQLAQSFEVEKQKLRQIRELQYGVQQIHLERGSIDPGAFSGNFTAPNLNLESPTNIRNLQYQHPSPLNAQMSPQSPRSSQLQPRQSQLQLQQQQPQQPQQPQKPLSGQPWEDEGMWSEERK